MIFIKFNPLIDFSIGFAHIAICVFLPSPSLMDSLRSLIERFASLLPRGFLTGMGIKYSKN